MTARNSLNGSKLEAQDWDALWFQVESKLDRRDSRCVKTYEKAVVVTRATEALTVE